MADPTPRRQEFAGLLLVTIGVCLADQATKVLTRVFLPSIGDKVAIWDEVFYLAHLENSGAAFGMLADAPDRMLVFVGVMALSLCAAVGSVWALAKEMRGMGAFVGLPLGGALGNSLDRFLRGSVTDFLVVQAPPGDLREWLVAKAGTYRWPAFNVADMALVATFLAFLPLLLWTQGDEAELPPMPPEPDPGG